jgi:hypothetical protein
MAIYGVVMGQGVSMAALGDNTLTTGYKSGEYLYSCSAIILANPATGSAGLYHFPAGEISGDTGSQTVIKAMIADVGPTAAWIVFGVTDYKRPDKPKDEPADAGQTHTLSVWLRDTLGFAVTLEPAKGGSAQITIAGGRAVVGQGTGTGVMDLEDYSAGLNEAGFKVYKTVEVGAAGSSSSSSSSSSSKANNSCCVIL